MSNTSTGLPGHLAPFLEPTPSGVAKLVAAWDGLNKESQILVLTDLDKARLPAYLNEKIRIKALDSANAYVRYLAARGLYFRRDDSEERKAVRQRIEEDPDPLVRYCLLEREWNLVDRDLKDPDAFFAPPHEARLAKVRSLKGSGEAMAKLIAHAIDHQLKEGQVSEIEVFEILSDYLNKPSFTEHYNPRRELSYDGFGEYLAGKDIEALWRLVLKVPASISHVLIEKLPPGVGLSPAIPDDVLKGMTGQQLATLFYRHDIEVRDLRKKVFFDPDEKRDDEVKSAAICYNFDLEYAEFTAVLARPEKEKVKILRDLAIMAHDLSLCFYDAIHDVLFATDVGLFDWQDAEFARDALERKLKELKGGHRERQLRELRLYRLAKQAVPWKRDEKGYSPSGELGFLSKSVVEGDAWGTFMSFSKAWVEDSWRTKKLEKHLPRIDEAGEDELGYDLQEEAEDKQVEPTDSLRQLSKDVTRLQATQDRQNLLLYVVIGLLVWLLIKLL